MPLILMGILAFTVLLALCYYSFKLAGKARKEYRDKYTSQPPQQ